LNWPGLAQDLLFDDRIWYESYSQGGANDASLSQNWEVRAVQLADGRFVHMLRPDGSGEDYFEYGMLYLEGSGGMGKDVEEARWYFHKGAEANDTHALYMHETGLEKENAQDDSGRVLKLETCFKLSLQRVLTNEDHQTLMVLYKMTLRDYHSKRALPMIAACYWRIGLEDRAVGFAGDMNEIFSPTDGLKTPPLSPRQSKWVELIAKDSESEYAAQETKSAGATQANSTDKPVEKPPLMPPGSENAFLLAALGLIGGFLYFVYGRMAGSTRGKEQKKKKKKA